VTLVRLLERQAGVVTLGQAVACGLSPDTVRRRVRGGRWTRIHPTVHLVGGHRLTGEARVWAASLYAGERSTVSGPAAAFRHGMLREPPDVVDVTVPAALHRRPRAGIRWHRHDLLSVDRVAIRGLWVTAPPLAALETALARPDGSTFLDRALQRHVRFPTVYRAYCRHLGRKGSTRARELICASADRADSAAERLLVRILRDGGVTGWELGHPFGPWRIDLAFPVQKVAVGHARDCRMITERSRSIALSSQRPRKPDITRHRRFCCCIGHSQEICRGPDLVGCAPWHRRS
jgi:hypothetical protein